MNHPNPINWSPYATNVLDAGLYDLSTPNGTPVEVRQVGVGVFFITIGTELIKADGNLAASYVMNIKEIGGTLKRTESSAY